jgi:cytochrome o ubiquinol oxidase subunit IV
MTDTQYDRALGDATALPDVEQGTSSGVLVYTIGLGLAVVLTAMSFWVANTSLLWVGGVALGLTVLAIAQMGIHLVFFLHVTTGPDNTNNVMALAFGVLIVVLVVVGSLLIMADLNDNMMPGLRACCQRFRYTPASRNGRGLLSVWVGRQRSNALECHAVQARCAVVALRMTRARRDSKTSGFWRRARTAQ